MRPPYHLLAAAVLVACGGAETPAPSAPDAAADVQLAVGCTPGRVEVCPCAGGGSGAQTCAANGTFGACVCPVADAGDAGPLDVAVDLGGDVAPADALDASDAATVPADIGPPPMLSEERATRSVRVALRVEGLTPGAPAAVYLEARNVRYTNAGTRSPSISFDACGPAGCLADCTANFNDRMTASDFGCRLASGVTLSATAAVLSSPVYTRPIASGAERVQNFAALVSAPATSSHGALVGVEGATASAMVGEVWLMGAPAATP